MLKKRLLYLILFAVFLSASSSRAAVACLEFYEGSVQARIERAQKEGAGFSQTYLRMIENTDLSPQVYLETALSRFATRRTFFDEEKIAQANNFLAVEEPKVKRTTDGLDRVIELSNGLDELVKKIETNSSGALAKFLSSRADKNNEKYFSEFELKLKAWTAAIRPMETDLNYLAGIIGTLERFQKELTPVLVDASVEFSFLESFNFGVLSSLEHFPKANRVFSQFYTILSGQIEMARNKRERIANVKTVVETNLSQLKLMKNLIEVNRDNPIDQIANISTIDDPVILGRLKKLVYNHLAVVRGYKIYVRNTNTDWATASTVVVDKQGNKTPIEPYAGIPTMGWSGVPRSSPSGVGTYTIPTFRNWQVNIVPKKAEQ